MNPTNLKTGDILHCTGDRLISRLIMKFTKSKFSHSAIFVEIWGQPFVIDAQKDGVNLRPWNEWMNKYNYKIVANRSTRDYNEKSLAKRAMTKIGHTGYDFESLIFKQPIELLTGKWFVKKNEQERMYCSEFVAWVYGAERSYRISPQDLYKFCTMSDFVEIPLI